DPRAAPNSTPCVRVACPATPACTSIQARRGAPDPVPDAGAEPAAAPDAAPAAAEPIAEPAPEPGAEPTSDPTARLSSGRSIALGDPSSCGSGIDVPPNCACSRFISCPTRVNTSRGEAPGGEDAKLLESTYVKMPW